MGCPATCRSVLGESKVWGLRRVPLPAVGIMTFNEIPSFAHLATLEVTVIDMPAVTSVFVPIKVSDVGSTPNKTDP